MKMAKMFPKMPIYFKIKMAQNGHFWSPCLSFLVIFSLFGMQMSSTQAQGQQKNNENNTGTTVQIIVVWMMLPNRYLITMISMTAILLFNLRGFAPAVTNANLLVFSRRFLFLPLPLVRFVFCRSLIHNHSSCNNVRKHITTNKDLSNALLITCFL